MYKVLYVLITHYTVDGNISYIRLTFPFYFGYTLFIPHRVQIYTILIVLYFKSIINDTVQVTSYFDRSRSDQPFYTPFLCLTQLKINPLFSFL